MRTLTWKQRRLLAFLIVAAGVVIVGVCIRIFGWPPVRDFVRQYPLHWAEDHAGAAAVLILGAAVRIVIKSDHWPRLTLFVAGALTASVIIVIGDVVVSLWRAPSEQWLSVDQAIEKYTTIDADRQLYENATHNLCIAQTNSQQFQDMNYPVLKISNAAFQARMAEFSNQINSATNNRLVPMRRMLNQLRTQLRQGDLVAQGFECDNSQPLSSRAPDTIPRENWEFLRLDVSDVTYQRCDESAIAMSSQPRKCYAGIVFRGAPDPRNE